MGQGERIEISNPCPLTPSSRRSLKPQGIRKSLNLQFGPNPILVTASLTLILMAGGLVIIWILFPIEVSFPSDRFAYIRGFAGFMWFLVIALLAGLIVAERVSMVE